MENVAFGFATALIVASAIFSPSQAHAVPIGNGTECENQYIKTEMRDSEGNLLSTTYEPVGVFCWDSGMDDRYGLPYGGGGGGVDSSGVWVGVTWDGVIVEINLVRKQVRTDHAACTDEDVIRQRAVQAIIVRDPQMAIGTQVTLVMGTQSQRFMRQNRTGTVQFIPVSTCQ